MLVGRASSAHAECKPAAVPHGDPKLVSTLIERLAASGIDTQPDPSCPAVRVQVRQRGQQVHLRVTDAYERLGEREVQDVATAAAIIESWTLQEIDAGSMPADSISPMPTLATRMAPSFGISAAFRTAMTGQSSTWVGATLSGCKRVSWSCIGASVSFAKDIEATGATSTDEHHIQQLDARATIEVPRSIGTFSISPGVAVGYGWQQIESQHLDAQMHPFTLTDASHGLHGNVHVRVGRAVSSRVSIFAEIAADRALVKTAPTMGPSSWFGISFGARFGSP